MAFFVLRPMLNFYYHTMLMYCKTDLISLFAWTDTNVYSTASVKFRVAFIQVIRLSLPVRRLQDTLKGKLLKNDHGFKWKPL